MQSEARPVTRRGRERDRHREPAAPARRRVHPRWAMVGGVLATLAIGALAGVYPAIRAARLAPTEALSAP